MDIFKAYAPISKVDDEQRMVYGYASTDTKDSQGDIVKLDAIEKALPDYMRFANIREMHTMSAVGVAKSAEVDEKGLYIGAKVVDETAWIKVKEGVYKGFSIGGKALKKSAGVIEELRLTEISLVDRPANQECVIDMWKAEGGDDAAAAAAPADATPEVAKADEQPAGETVEKGMYNMQRLIEALQCIKNAMGDASYEQKYGEHSAEMIADMKAAYVALGAVAQKYLAEEINPPAKPVEVSMADGADDDLAKAGATYSKATKAALMKLHGMIRDCDKMMKGMGYDKDDMTKADDGEELSKAEALAKAEADLAKVSAERDELAKRVTELEAQPEPAKAAVTTVEKTDDTKDGLATGAGFQPDPNDPLSMFKAALARPLVVGAPISKPSSVN